MHADFWHRRWSENRIGFHKSSPNSHLVAQIDQLNLSTHARIFVPLCGKSLDIAWLAGRGYRVVGIELSELAVESLFDEAGLKAEITSFGRLRLYKNADIEIFVGDFFDLGEDVLGLVDATYDRAALVALPEEMRQAYARHLIEVTGCSPQLLITFDYDQSLAEGPPFSVPEEEVRRIYSKDYDLVKLSRTEAIGGMKGICPAMETVWYLKPN